MPRQSTLTEFRQCMSQGCRFRYPVVAPVPGEHWCPRCGFKTESVAMTSNRPTETLHDESYRRLWIVPYLDNIRSAYNVGSIFRTADGVGIETIHLGGISPTPEHPKVMKTALGAQKAVKWEHHLNGVMAVKQLRGDNYRIWSVENTPTAERMFNIDLTSINGPILLVLGNEKAGIDPGILEMSDKIISLPMLGRKSSLNVVVAFGIVAYYLRFGYQQAGEK